MEGPDPEGWGGRGQRPWAEEHDRLEFVHDGVPVKLVWEQPEQDRW